MRKIVISYRRSEAEYAAGALGRELRRYFGNEQVFRDKEDIGGGVSWKQQVLAEIDHDSAMLVLIGKEWAQAKDEEGKRRLESSDDPIWLEVTDGITQGATVIPVLLENVQMPGAGDLPPALKPMAEFNALRLRDGDWDYDLDHICRTLEKTGFKPTAGATVATQIEPTSEAEPSVAPAKTSRGVPIKLIASYVVGVLALAGFSETHDPRTAWGLAILSLIAIVLAGLAYRDYQQGRSNSMWPAIGAIVLGTLATLSYLGTAVDRNRHSVATMQIPDSTKPAPTAPPGQSLTSLPAVHNPAPIAKPETTPAIGEAPPARESGAPNIAGRWKDADDDSAIVFSQDGSRVHMIATQQGIALEGSGSMSGRQLRMNLSMAGVEFAEMQLTLSPDGRAMQGTMSSDGKVERVKIVR